MGLAEACVCTPCRTGAAAAGTSEQESVGKGSKQGAMWAVDLSLMGREGGEGGGSSYGRAWAYFLLFPPGGCSGYRRK